MEKAFWLAIRANDYKVPQGHSPTGMMEPLLEMLGATDPELRDRCAYEILATWISRGHYSPDERRSMAERLTAALKWGIGEPESDTVFRRAFAVLILGEIVQRDSQERSFSAGELRSIFAACLEYLAAEKDLRGFVPEKGWAHACAHTADALGALAGHPALGSRQLEQILEAVADRVTAPTDAPFIANEENRLVLAALAVLKRESVSQGFLTRWLKRLAEREEWRKGFGAGRNMGAYHNTMGFLKSLHILLEGRPLQAEVRLALKAMAPWLF